MIIYMPVRDLPSKILQMRHGGLPQTLKSVIIIPPLHLCLFSLLIRCGFEVIYIYIYYHDTSQNILVIQLLYIQAKRELVVQTQDVNLFKQEY